MNYFDCKKLKRMIDIQRLEVAELRCRSASISVSIDGMPKASNNGSRTERSVEKLTIEEEKLRHLERMLYSSLIAIPDEYIRKLIHLKILRGKSWNWIAIKLGGSNTGDSVRKACVRYHW